MKKLLLPVIILLFSAACTRDDKGGSRNNTISSNPVSGNWKVSYFYDNDKDETSDYTGYTFAFNNNGGLSVSGSGLSANGTWAQISDDGQQKLVISITTTNDKLQELNDDWVINSKTDTQIKLSDDNASRNEQLHFQKQ